MKTEFINVAAHELRTPIQPILGLSEVLRSRTKDAQQQELLDVIIRNARRSQGLTNDILDVTKIESQSLNLKKEWFNLNDVIYISFSRKINNYINILYIYSLLFSLIIDFYSFFLLITLYFFIIFIIHYIYLL